MSGLILLMVFIGIGMAFKKTIGAAKANPEAAFKVLGVARRMLTK